MTRCRRSRTLSGFYIPIALGFMALGGLAVFFGREGGVRLLGFALLLLGGIGWWLTVRPRVGYDLFRLVVRNPFATHSVPMSDDLVVDVREYRVGPLLHTVPVLRRPGSPDALVWAGFEAGLLAPGDTSSQLQSAIAAAHRVQDR